MADEKIIKQRIPVWQALSRLYFLSEINTLESIVKGIINVCRDSGYSFNLIEKIYAYEIIPALAKNVRGWDAEFLWKGVKSEFLCEIILDYTHGKLMTENSLPTFWQKLSSRYRVSSTKDNWQYIKALLAKSIN